VPLRTRGVLGYQLALGGLWIWRPWERMHDYCEASGNCLFSRLSPQRADPFRATTKLGQHWALGSNPWGSNS